MAKPRRLPNPRRAPTCDETDQINEAARASGDDVVLDVLLLCLHTETASRRGSALGLRAADLDVRNRQVHLTEKAGTQRWQPITLGFARHLLAFAGARGSSVAVG
ncbi:integrase [Hamadaea flava]|uniref:Tyr recombinase domain-containing protein n=1 Tax=Hamadaea flava TaxID=1742688 RepID=A0ABV8LFE2_9ACTN|nr:hypothetical protein [Hamadaea flava]MCP2323369.1 integrase [Hamadaea flava]